MVKDLSHHAAMKLVRRDGGDIRHQRGKGLGGLIERCAVLPLARGEVTEVPLHRSVKFRYAPACLTVGRAKKERRQPVREGL